MQILTPTGYRDASSLAVGDEVCAFDAETGESIVNHVEAVQPVDYGEWCRWWQVEETVPTFTWYRINGAYLLFGEQSIWRNGTSVCHAKNLVVGDEIYDDGDHAVTIANVEVVTDESLIWYRFDISGDHSYVIDGLTVHNASRFWVGGTGTWDSSTTTHWAASSNGAGGQSVPGSADAVTFDANSGGGTVTPNFDITVQSITMGVFNGGTLDFSANNNNVTLQVFNGSGAGVRAFKMGNGTWTVTGSSWSMLTTTSLTFSANSSSLVFTSSGVVTFSGGAITYNIVTVSITSSSIITFNGSTSVATLNINAAFVKFQSLATFTISTLNVLGTSGAPVLLQPDGNTNATLSVASNPPSISWAAIRGLTCSGGATFTATNSFDVGNNSGITITPPGGSFGVIG
jgi:hypothetical protein